MALFHRIQLKSILVLFIVLFIRLNCINCQNICDNCLEESEFENSFRIKRDLNVINDKRSDSSTESVISDQNQSNSKSNSTNFTNNRFVL
jgi:hypothetical protein